MQGTSKGELPLSVLPKNSRVAHKMNVSQNLLSLGVCADDNLISILDKDKILICNEESVKIQLTKKPVLQGYRAQNGLWKIPLTTPSTGNNNILWNKRAQAVYSANTV